MVMRQEGAMHQETATMQTVSLPAIQQLIIAQEVQDIQVRLAVLHRVEMVQQQMVVVVRLRQTQIIAQEAHGQQQV
jgi:hypothetical protein